jgi:hypothetical protein
VTRDDRSQRRPLSSRGVVPAMMSTPWVAVESPSVVVGRHRLLRGCRERNNETPGGTDSHTIVREYLLTIIRLQLHGRTRESRIEMARKVRENPAKVSCAEVPHGKSSQTQLNIVARAVGNQFRNSGEAARAFLLPSESSAY